MKRLLAVLGQQEQFHVRTTELPAMGGVAPYLGGGAALRGVNAVRFFQSHHIRVKKTISGFFLLNSRILEKLVQL